MVDNFNFYFVLQNENGFFDESSSQKWKMRPECYISDGSAKKKMVLNNWMFELKSEMVATTNNDQKVCNW